MLVKKKVGVVLVVFIFFALSVMLLQYFFFADKILQSPDSELTESSTNVNSLANQLNLIKGDKLLLKQNQDELKNSLVHAEDEDYTAVIKRFLENPGEFPTDSPLIPVKLNLDNYNVRITHGEEILDGELKRTETKFELIDVTVPLAEQKAFEINFINDHNYPVSPALIFDSEVYQVNDKIYAVITEPPIIPDSESDESSTITGKSLLTGYQVYSPPVPFNQVNRNFAVIVPYNNNFPLPANAVSYLNAKFPYVSSYFQANSEGTATYTFTIYPVNVPNYDPSDIQINDVIVAADPSINYAQYDLALIHAPMTYCCGGFASMSFGSQGIAYFNTNEPLRMVVPVTMFDPSNSDPNRFTEFITQHEIGHLLTAFNPIVNFNYFAGYLPHARGFNQFSYPCSTNGPVNFCNPGEYGDQLDVMGTGSGLFSHHRAVHDLGFRNPSSVQSVSASGTYNLCSTNHPAPANCPQEILIQNSNGANLALELIANPLGPEYSLYQNCQNFFDSIILRVTDLEQGGGLGNNLYFSGFYGGDVIYPVSSTPSTCTSPLHNPTMIDFPLHQGQSVTTPVGTINFQALTTTSTGKQATISLNYNVPACATGPPIVVLNVQGGHFQVYQQNLWAVNFWSSGAVRVRSSSSCVAPNTVTMTTQVNVAGTIHTNTQTIPLPMGGFNDYGLNLPTSLIGSPAGIYPLTITITPTSAPTQSTIVNGQLELVAYDPLSLFAAVPTSYCSDLDFTSTLPLGANFQSPYPSIGGVVVPNPQITGLPPIIYAPDWCVIDGQGNYLASDVVCSNNIAGLPPNYGAVLYKDCRFETNNINGYCSNGVCY